LPAHDSCPIVEEDQMVLAGDDLSVPDQLADLDLETGLLGHLPRHGVLESLATPHLPARHGPQTLPGLAAPLHQEDRPVPDDDAADAHDRAISARHRDA